jgi:hypothetical protein
VQPRSDSKRSVPRRALTDVTNLNPAHPDFRRAPASGSYPPVEHMHLPPPPPKYQGVDYVPSNEPWFDDPLELEPTPSLGHDDWP